MNTKTLAVAALMLVAGCATGGVSLTQQDISASYSPGEFAYAGAGRDLRVVVVGNPFGGGRAAFESAVTGAMQGRHWGQAVNFTTMPGANARTSYRVVLLFGPPATLNAMRLCREEESALPTIPAAGADGTAASASRRRCFASWSVAPLVSCPALRVLSSASGAA